MKSRIDNRVNSRSYFLARAHQVPLDVCHSERIPPPLDLFVDLP
jgi:hypothetical protein